MNSAAAPSEADIGMEADICVSTVRVNIYTTRSKEDTRKKKAVFSCQGPG